MDIIAKTKTGVLINATDEEVKEILNAVNGTKPKELEVGMRIPAIDYVSTIRKIQTLSSEYSFRQVVEYSKNFTSVVQELADRVEAASHVDTQGPMKE